VSRTPARRSGSPQTDIEDAVLERLAEIGLTVPTRDPLRPHTKAEGRCFKTGGVGFPGGRGKPWHGPHPCECPGCRDCAPRRAERQLSGLRRA